MYKIAVMINGHPKYLDITQQLFKHWNTLYDNFKFDFFVSTWEDDTDYSDWDWITKWERLKEEDCPYDLKNHEEGRHQPHYCYTFKKVNELRNSYDEEYDAVLQTRSDIIISRRDLDDMLSKITAVRGIGDERINPQLSLRNIFSISGTAIHNVVTDEGKVHQDLWTQDYYFFGKPEVFDIFAGMFDYIFIDKKYGGSILMHVFQAEYLHTMGIYNSSLSSGAGVLLIREPYRFAPAGTHTNAGWHKKNPSPYQLQKIIDEQGLDWIFNIDNWKKIRNFFGETKK